MLSVKEERSIYSLLNLVFTLENCSMPYGPFLAMIALSVCKDINSQCYLFINISTILGITNINAANLGTTFG